MSRTEEEIKYICEQLLQGVINTQALEVSLEEFQKFYTTIVHLKKEAPIVSFVNLETTVKAQFSNVSPQHFDIVHASPLTKNDFEFIVNQKWYGNEGLPQHFITFLWGELKQNWLKLTPLFILSSTLLYIANSPNLYEVMATLLIQSSTVFLSIYLIFTVSQSQSLQKDSILFKRGILQNYFRDDKNITFLGILTIALTFLSSMSVSVISVLVTPTTVIQLQILGRILQAVLVSTSVVLLFNTFLIVANYYLERTKDVFDRDIASDLLHEDYTRYSKNN